MTLIPSGSQALFGLACLSWGMALGNCLPQYLIINVRNTDGSTAFRVPAIPLFGIAAVGCAVAAAHLSN